MNRLALRLIGLGLWLATERRNRVAFERLDTLAMGRWAIAQLNDATQRAELARRHAKPSSRKRVR